MFEHNLTGNQRTHVATAARQIAEAYTAHGLGDMADRANGLGDQLQREMMDQGTMADVDHERFAGSVLDNDLEAAMDALMVGVDPDNVPAPVADEVTDKVIGRILRDADEDNVPF